MIDLHVAPLSALSADELLARLGELTSLARRVDAATVAVIAELDQRGVASEKGFASPVALVSRVTRTDPREAGRLVRHSRLLCPRVTTSGELLEPQLPVLAAACASGDVSLAHARLIIGVITRLPDQVGPDERLECEKFLTEQARVFEPRTLGLIARRLQDTIDPDGVLVEEAQRARERGLTFYQRPDGSARMSGELTAVCAEAVLSVLDAQGRPARGDGIPDPRTPGQRRHDALQEALLTALRSGSLGSSGGVAATILLTMTREQAQTGEGLARTGHGALIPVPTALSLSGDGQAQVIVLNKVGAIEAYSSTQRLFTRVQRLAMSVRDGGCSFPSCTVPSAWCEAHHVVAWADGGPTSVSNGTLLCGYHHAQHERLGWTCRMIDGLPHWIPPKWLDPHRTPRRNTAHGPPATS